MTTIAFVNESTVLTDTEVKAALPAFQTQVTRDFAPVWGTDATVTWVDKTTAPPSDAWLMAILDNSDQAGALGYHDVTDTGLPLSKVFAMSDLMAGATWSVTVSHELLEMLGDPNIVTSVTVNDPTKGQVMYALEVCDAPEADEYGYQIDNVLVSDFVTPAWFGQPGDQYDYGKHISAPFQILPGGYIGMWTPTTGWTQYTGDQRRYDHFSRAQVGSRRERRAISRSNWIPSLNFEERQQRRENGVYSVLKWSKKIPGTWNPDSGQPVTSPER